jgi:heptosyltransferase-3
MPANDDILSLLREKGAQAALQTQRGVILQPGAIGDCVLNLPLAEFMKESLAPGGVDILGHTEYIGILPGRTCVNGVRSIDSTDLHRLFVESKTFDLADGDPLINVFADYAWIVTFLGEADSDFEQNLIFTANCSHSAEVITLSMKPPKGYHQHITDFYRQQFIEQSGSSLEHWPARSSNSLVRATPADRAAGKTLLQDAGVDLSTKLVVIHPGSGGRSKCWHLDNFLAVAKELCSSGTEVVFMLGPAEQERFSRARLKDVNSVATCLADLSLTQVLQVLSCTDGFVGNDSGITHLAAGMGIRTLAVFGPTNPAVYAPIGPVVTVFANTDSAFAKKPSTTLQQELVAVLLA